MKKTRFKRLVSNTARRMKTYDRWGLIDKMVEAKASRAVLEENERLECAPPVIMDWPADVRKPRVGLVKSEFDKYAYWPKFERFLINNEIPYEFYDVYKSTFADDADRFDIIVWRTISPYYGQWEAKDKIEFMQDFLHKHTLPPREALWFYEDKVREQWLFEYYKLPCIKTFISHSREEVEAYIENAKYPFISKDKTCSGSNGVIIVKDKHQARKMCRLIFTRGLKLHESYIRQKNYVLFQELVPNKGFDLRVIIIGNSYFGYYRYPQKGDFKASGSGIVVKKEIPVEVLRLAARVRDCLPKSYLLAVDFLQDTRDDKYYIIESSIFISVETCEQLVIDNLPGRYVEQNGEFIFEPGRFWLQELMMQELMNDWILEMKRKNNV
ncbi:MAG TPA: hypothetical protein PK830_00140 [Candidatus Atribacteria bacterium]|nr:hypothetical protein [Candidatus Atribacteria bacterium]